jgi:hypothetical protein
MDNKKRKEIKKGVIYMHVAKICFVNVQGNLQTLVNDDLAYVAPARQPPEAEEVKHYTTSYGGKRVHQIPPYLRIQLQEDL